MGGGSRSTFPRWLLFQGAKASATRLSLNPVSGTLAYAWGGGGGGGKDECVDFTRVCFLKHMHIPLLCTNAFDCVSTVEDKYLIIS